jgi:iron complex outermembrane receptor protein
VAPLDGVVGHFEGEHWDHRAAIQYSWTDDFMTYAQVSTGFKGGGVNPRPFVPNQVAAHQPETLAAYEIGFKSDWFDNRARLNVAAFFNEYEDILMTVATCPAPMQPAPCALPINAGQAEVQGAEAELSFNPIGALSIDASIAYLDFQYTSISVAGASSGITLSMRAPFTPEWQYSVGVQYEIPLGENSGTLTPRFDLSYQDDFFTTAINRAPFNVTPERTLLNGRLSWDAPDESWRIALEVTNLTDELYYHSIRDDRTSSLTVQGMPAPPRRWALAVRRNF